MSYGQVALGLTLVNLANQTIVGPLGNGINRFYAPALEGGDIAGYGKSVRRLIAQATALIIALMFAFDASLWVAHQSRWIAIATTSFLLAIASGYNSFLSGILNAARLRLVASIHQGIEPFARFMGASALILAFAPVSAVALAGYCIGVVAVLTSQYAFTSRFLAKQLQSASPNEDWGQRILAFSAPFTTWGIFTWGQQASDRWALEFFTSTHEVGLYAIVFQLGYYPLSLVSGMAMQFFAPIFYQRAGAATDVNRTADLTTLAVRLTGWTLLVTALAFLATYFLHPVIFGIFVSAPYRHVSYLLPWVVLSGGLFAAGQTLALTLMSQMRPHAMIAAKIVTAVIGIGLNLLFAYRFGLPGVVAASVLFSGGYLLWLALLVRQDLNANVTKLR
ncbi:MAG TPA: hypothetical protein VJ840_03905 [Gemmatimonadaceae bacterium]|nr:hypothetical protein [Gemmatimonadaceae bacterium]